MDVDLKLAIKNRQWGIVAEYATRAGRFKRHPTAQIKLELIAHVKGLTDMGRGDNLEQDILEWLGL